MLIFKPEYYDRFHCLASACPDSCCKEWDVQVDAQMVERYRSLPGEFGCQVNRALRDSDGETVIAMVDGHCPLWQADDLCGIQRELGEEWLCSVCREYPRLTHDYGDFQELGLELSCPEAARLILTAPPSPLLSQSVPGQEPVGYDREAMAVLRSTRETMLSLLSDESRPVNQVLTLGLLYGCQVQSELDGGGPMDFDPESALAEAGELAKPGNMEDIFAFFRNLEILTPQWRELLSRPVSGAWVPAHLALARYFVQRYWLQSVSDFDLYSRVKFAVIACLLIKHLPGDLLPTAQLFSKEIENDADNMDALLDAAYTCPAFRDDHLLGLLHH